MDMKFVWLLIANVLLLVLLRLFRNRKKLNTVITVLFTTLVTLTVIEGAYRLFFRKKGATETGNFGSSMNIPESLTGYTIKNIPKLEVTKSDAQGNLIYKAAYSIIPDSGFNTLPLNHRIAYNINDPSRDSLEFVFLGCSFTFGTGVADTATMAYRVGKQLNYNTVNLGGSGFGTHQAYQIFTHKYNQVPDHKKRVFVYTLIPDHLLRAKCIYTWCLNDPYFEVAGDSLKLLGPAYKNTSAARSQVLVRLFSLNRALSLVADLGNNIVQTKGAESVTEKDYQRVGLMLQQMNQTIQARGDVFIVIHWDDYKGSANPKGGYYVDQEKIKSLLTQLPGARVVNASSFFDSGNPANIIAQDNHPSGQGNALMAGAVIQALGQP